MVGGRVLLCFHMVPKLNERVFMDLGNTIGDVSLPLVRGLLFGRISMIFSMSLESRTAPHNSIRGRVIFWMDATLVFVLSRDKCMPDSLMTLKQMHAT